MFNKPWGVLAQGPVHASWASWNTQSTTCARNLGEAVMENFCYHLPLRFFFHSELHFHLHGKGNRPAVRWEIEANSSQVLEFPSGLSLIQHIWASLGFFSLSFATLCSKEVLEQYFTWHIPAFIWNTKKVQFSSNMRRELGNMQRLSKHLVGLELYRGVRCCSWPCLPPHTEIYGYLWRLVFSLGSETQME